jgi:hypothetical protein
MRACLLLAVLLLSAPASAEVLSASEHGFEIQHSVNLVVPQAQTFAAFARVGEWWGKDHTYSGDSARITVQMRHGGCWCETLEGGGGIEHMRVTFLKPGEQVVFTGSLGPLLYEATSGVMHVKVDPIAGGSKITLNYRAAGFANGGGAKMAPLVDKVLADQMKRFRAYAAAAPKPDSLKP